MHALPFLISLVSAVALAPALLRMLLAGGHTRVNYRARALPSPFGVLVLLAAVAALVPVMLLQELATLGLVDDTLGDGRDAPRAGEPGRAPARGWRGHGAAVLRGELSTGALKAVGSLGLALFATSPFNLLDLRPGRAVKAFVLLGLGVGLGSGEARPLWALGLFAAPALVAG